MRALSSEDAGSARKRLDADLRHFLPALRVPVAVIVGEEDYATPVAMAQQLHESIRSSTLTIIPGGRHLTPMECPEQVASQLMTLLQRVIVHAGFMRAPLWNSG